MKLNSFSYKNKDWELKDLEFDTVSLIVGKNATGKSRSLAAIDLFCKIITQKVNLPANTNWKVSFSKDDGTIINYLFSTSSQEDNVIVTQEKITINDKELLIRENADTASLYNTLEKQSQKVYPPANKLVIHVNRDIKRHPYMEDFAQWAESSFGFKFAAIAPTVPFDEQKYDLMTAIDEIPALYKLLGKTNKDKIMQYVQDMGFKIESIQFREGNPSDYLYIMEFGNKDVLPHFELSQGMFRTVALLIFLEYVISKKKPATIIIDDLCEGLDYERATKLGQIVFENCKNNNIQLIATSNDMFLMDVIDIEYWNILQRKNGVVSSLNPKRNKELFDEFRFTGLSNFDLFSSDFILKSLKHD